MFWRHSTLPQIQRYLYKQHPLLIPPSIPSPPLMTKRYHYQHQHSHYSIPSSLLTTKSKVTSIWPAYDGSYLARLQSAKDNGQQVQMVHFNKKGIRLAWLNSRKAVSQMLNDQELITLDIPANIINIFSLKKQQKVSIHHECLPYHRVEIFVFPATNTFCLCQNRQNSLRLTYYICHDLDQHKIDKEEVLCRHVRTRTAQKVNDHSRVMWQTLSYRDPTCFYLQYFQLENNSSRRIRQLTTKVDVRGVDSNQEVLQLRSIRQIGQDKYLVYGLGEEELGEDMEQSGLPGLNFKVETHYYNGFFIMAVDSLLSTAYLTKIKTWKDIQLQGEDQSVDTFKLLGQFASTRKALVNVHPSLHQSSPLHMVSSSPLQLASSFSMSSYFANLRNKETGQLMGRWVSFTPSSGEDRYSLYTIEEYDLKAVYLFMLQQVNQDFDEDLLMDACQLLVV